MGRDGLVRLAKAVREVAGVRDRLIGMVHFVQVEVVTPTRKGKECTLGLFKFSLFSNKRTSYKYIIYLRGARININTYINIKH